MNRPPTEPRLITVGEIRHDPRATRHLLVAEVGLAVVAAGAALAFGGVQTLTVTLMEVAVLLLAVYVFWRLDWPALGRAPWAVLALLAALPVVQMVSLPRAAVRLISPARVAIEDKLLAPFGVALGWTTFSVNTHATLMALLKQLCYLLVFLLAYHIYRSRGRASGLIPALITLGTFEAAYGMVQYLGDWHYIFTYKKRFNLHAATGTYINPNNYAGLLGMVLPFVLALILLRLPGANREARDGTRRRREIPGPWLAHVLLFMLMLLSLLFSQSEMGLLAAAAGMVVVAALAASSRKRRSGWVLVALVLGLAAAYGLWIGVAPVIERFEPMDSAGHFTEDLRPKIWRETLLLIGEFPVTGVGLGGYRWAMPHYQAETIRYYLDYAHNDYLQFAAELGVPATLVLFGALWVLFVKTARRAQLLERTTDRILAAGCAGALMPLLLHSLVEFNFQIPANAFIYAWIAGTAAAVCGTPLSDSRETPALVSVLFRDRGHMDGPEHLV